MKHGQRKAGRMRGAIPPPRYTPPWKARQREVACGCAVGRDETFERADARRASGLECRSRDRGRQIVGWMASASAFRIDADGELGECSRGRVLTRRARCRRVHIPWSTRSRERVLVGVARREVDMSAFRCARNEAPVDVWQQRDAQTGARGNQRDVAAARRRRPSCTTSISSDVSTGMDHASASRSLSKYARGMATSRRSASRSTIHGTFVRCARAPVIGPATPNARRFDVARSRRRSREENARTRRRDRESRACDTTVSRWLSAARRRGRTGQGRFSFRRRRLRAAWLAIVQPVECLTSTRPYCIFLASARVECRRAMASAP